MATKPMTNLRAMEAQEIAAMAEAYAEAGHEMDWQNPHKTRRAYLKGLAEDHGVPLSAVLAMADVLGPSEDFDGLVSEIQDIAECGDFDD